jgi:hypothetical protein
MVLGAKWEERELREVSIRSIQNRKRDFGENSFSRFEKISFRDFRISQISIFRFL